jgi:hypothetical protein
LRRFHSTGLPGCRWRFGKCTTQQYAIICGSLAGARTRMDTTSAIMPPGLSEVARETAEHIRRPKSNQGVGSLDQPKLPGGELRARIQNADSRVRWPGLAVDRYKISWPIRVTLMRMSSPPTRSDFPTPRAAPSRACRQWLNLVHGHQRFLVDKPVPRDLSTKHQMKLATGQRPFAVVLECADSRESSELAGTRLIGMTGASSREMVAVCYEQGCDAHLNCPVAAQESRCCCKEAEAHRSPRNAVFCLCSLLPQ